MSDGKPSETKPPEGFGGWLLLPMIGVCLAPIRTLVEGATLLASYGPVLALPNGKAVVAIEVALNLGLLALQIVVLVAMFGRRSTFPRFFRWLWITSIVLPLLDIVAVSALLGVSPDQLIDADMARVAASAVVMGLWVWYMQVSVRVKNTFTR